MIVENLLLKYLRVFGLISNVRESPGAAYCIFLPPIHQPSIVIGLLFNIFLMLRVRGMNLLSQQLQVLLDEDQDVINN